MLTSIPILAGNPGTKPIRELVEATYCTVDINTEVTVLAELFRRSKVAIVLDESNHPEDIITRIDLIDYVSRATRPIMGS